MPSKRRTVVYQVRTHAETRPSDVVHQLSRAVWGALLTAPDPGSRDSDRWATLYFSLLGIFKRRLVRYDACQNCRPPEDAADGPAEDRELAAPAVYALNVSGDLDRFSRGVGAAMCRRFLGARRSGEPRDPRVPLRVTSAVRRCLSPYATYAEECQECRGRGDYPERRVWGGMESGRGWSSSRPAWFVRRATEERHRQPDAPSAAEPEGGDGAASRSRGRPWSSDPDQPNRR
jgi:hypothetical protein